MVNPKNVFEKSKALIIPPLLYENRFVTCFTKEDKLFNSFFVKQFTIIYNGSSISFELLLKTDKFYSDTSYASDDIVKINQNLDSEKAHDHDKISIGMLKICGSSIFKPLEIISESYFENRIFPLERKNSKCCYCS